MIADVLSWALILTGGFFCLVGAFGIIRFPDFYTRLHASGVLDPFGVSLIMVGLMIQAGFTLVTVKLVFIVALLLLTTPVSCHALARAALHRGLKPLPAKTEDQQSKR